MIHLHSQPLTYLNKQRHADPQKTGGLASVTCRHIRGSHQSIPFLIITWRSAAVRSMFSAANHSSHELARQNIKQNAHDVMTIPNMDIRLLSAGTPLSLGASFDSSSCEANNHLKLHVGIHPFTRSFILVVVTPAHLKQYFAYMHHATASGGLIGGSASCPRTLRHVNYKESGVKA